MSQFSPADPTTVNGYDYDATSQMWKTLCSGLPCDALMTWPGYETAVLETTIDGQPAIIQCWKGLCEDAVDRITLPAPYGTIDFPGGFGAEVGVYRRDHTRTLQSVQQPAVSSTWPQQYRAAADAWFKLRMAKLQLQGVTDYWWPADDLVKATGPVTFSMFDNVFGDELISDYCTDTYWTCQWMRPHSWIAWAIEYNLRHSIAGHVYAPAIWDFTLRFVVAGVQYVWDTNGLRVGP